MLRRGALALALLTMLPLAARGQEQAPLDFLKSIYEPYKQPNFKGQPYWEAQRFFAPDLAAAIERDMSEAKKRKEVPALDGDPFIDAQDWQISSVGYAVSPGTGEAAAVVHIVNLGQPQQLAVFLIRTNAGWRIGDIAGRGPSLRALYKLQ